MLHDKDATDNIWTQDIFFAKMVMTNSRMYNNPNKSLLVTFALKLETHFHVRLFLPLIIMYTITYPHTLIYF